VDLRAEGQGRAGVGAVNTQGADSRPATIFALASGRPPAGIAVVRVSGPAAREVLAVLAGEVPAPRRAHLATLRDASGEVLDRALVLFFPAPASFTGEDVAELHLHGGRAVVAAVLAALGGLPGLVPAEAGAFTRRAFENGRLDLTAVEGLADLVAAETEAQRRQAIRQSGGALAARAESWRRRLIHARAMIEADLDFSDEDDVPDSVPASVWTDMAVLRAELAAVLAEGTRGERLRGGYLVALAGPPNAGKSTLMNVLAGRDVAIVTDIPGTTRDVLEVFLDLGGLPVTVADTAGIREAAERIEAEGIRRARARAAAADIVLWLDEAGARTPADLVASVEANGGVVWPVATKADLAGGARSGSAISARTGEGIEALVERIAAHLATLLPPEDAGITRARHRACLADAVAALGPVLADPPPAPELRAEGLRLASDALARLVGRIDVEDLLDVVFAEFCIGK